MNNRDSLGELLDDVLMSPRTRVVVGVLEGIIAATADPHPGVMELVACEACNLNAAARQELNKHRRDASGKAPGRP